MRKMDELKIKTLITNEEIKKRTKELAQMITNDYKGKDIHVICVLTGAIIFMTDLINYIENDRLTIDMMDVTSYGVEKRESTGQIKILKDLDAPIEGKNVLIVEDIIDSGNTLKHLKDLLIKRNPKSIKCCTMLDKPMRREQDITPDYVGFTIENVFVLGYGLDYDEYYRNLPYVGYVES